VSTASRPSCSATALVADRCEDLAPHQIAEFLAERDAVGIEELGEHGLDLDVRQRFGRRRLAGAEGGDHVAGESGRRDDQRREQRERQEEGAR
jgi:hypothetical protein